MSLKKNTVNSTANTRTRRHLAIENWALEKPINARGNGAWESLQNRLMRRQFLHCRHAIRPTRSTMMRKWPLIELLLRFKIAPMALPTNRRK